MSPVKPHPRGSISSPLVKIVLAWLVALALAFGHHAFYKSLDNTVAPSTVDSTSITSQFNIHSQAGASAVGTMFAWLVAAALGLSAGTAFIQCAWVVVQQRATSVAGLDALWSSPKNALAFLSLDMWRSAHVVVLVSALAWAFPLIVTFAPGTLTVRTQTVYSARGCTAPTYDFGTNDALYTDYVTEESFYLRPSTLAQRIVGGVLLSGQHLTPTSMCGTNCSYEITAYAPYFNCSTSSFNATIEDAFGRYVLGAPYNATSFDSSPTQNKYGVEETQLAQQGWDFSAALSNYATFQPDYTSGLEVTCIAYNASYLLAYDFNNGPNVAIKDIQPVQMATQFKDLNPPPNEPDFIDGNATNPHTAFYNATTNYYAVFQTLYSYIAGSVKSVPSLTGASFVVTPDTLLLPATAFVATPSSAEPQGNFSWRTDPDFPTAMQDLMTNISLSLLSGAVDPSQTTETTCTFTDTFTHFVYNHTRLWLIYVLGLGAALLCDLAGLWALWRNKFGGGAEFSEFVRATRSRELNHLDLSDEEWQAVRLQYGPVGSEGGRYAFVTPEILRRGRGRGAENVDGDADAEELKAMTMPVPSPSLSPRVSYVPFGNEQHAMSFPNRG
uniref:Uncharacterized protein n=1 Tax=Mycena chlorophos TaxID=658473 RepID=A0ABQ0MC25_MYCCL|nr:predicted protein [Mycena chlorophos]